MSQLLKYCDGIQHIGIPTKNIEKSKAFYEELGFETVHAKVIRDGKQRVIFLKFQNLVLEVYEDPTKEMAGAIDHFAINCCDIETAYADALKSGYRILSEEIEDLPFWEKGVRFFIIEGPDKERVEFNQIL